MLVIQGSTCIHAHRERYWRIERETEEVGGGGNRATARSYRVGLKSRSARCSSIVSAIASQESSCFIDRNDAANRCISSPRLLLLWSSARPVIMMIL